MLSKSELKFLIQGGTGNPKHDAVMRHRIRRKLLKFQRDDLPALKHNGVGTQLLDATLKITENCNDITEFRNAGENENSPNNAPFAKTWWARGDSNPGTSPCQGDVIATRPRAQNEFELS